jgi:hypothetical protein
MIAFRMERIGPPRGWRETPIVVGVLKAEPVPPSATDVQHTYDVYDEGADGAVTRVS